MTRGFTLIELIIVLVVMAILAITAGPRVLGTSSVSEQASRDQLISVLRLMQLQAMQHTSGSCFTLLLTDTLVQPDTSAGCASADTDSVYRLELNEDGSSFSALSLLTSATLPFPLQLRFDRLGRPLSHPDGLKLRVNGSSIEEVCIEAQGYIHPCS